MEWHPAIWSVCLPLFIFPCTIKSRGSLLAPAHPGGPGKRGVKRLWCGAISTLFSKLSESVTASHFVSSNSTDMYRLYAVHLMCSNAQAMC